MAGVPCAHAISAIWTTSTDPLEYVDPCYSVETYLQCYEPCIRPLNGEKEWERNSTVHPLPPMSKKTPGRPKKARNKGEAEIQIAKEKKMKLRRVGQFNGCTFCSQLGRNKRTCNARKEAELSQATGGDSENVQQVQKNNDGRDITAGIDGLESSNADCFDAVINDPTTDYCDDNEQVDPKPSSPFFVDILFGLITCVYIYIYSYCSYLSG